jgi:hypothetical protein
MSIHGLLIRRRVKMLQEFGSPKVKHKLRIYAELGREPERSRVVLLVHSKSRAESDEGAIKPPHYISDVLRLNAVHCETRHKNRRSLLVKRLGNGADVGGIGVPRAAHCAHTEPKPPVGRLVGGEELEEPSFVRRHSRRVGACKIEEETDGSARIHSSKVPAGCPTVQNRSISA